MTALQPVSFKKGRGHQPRLSTPNVRGKRHERYWSDAEKQVVRTYFPRGGYWACAAHLGPHRTKSAVYGEARKLGLSAPARQGGGKKQRIVPPADFDDTLRQFYQNDDGKKRGACNAFADRHKLPRWWVTKRAISLGLVMPHKKEPPWAAREKALMRKLPLHDLDRSAAIMRQHGFRRSPTAIMVMAKRLQLSRRFREAMSAQAVSRILGIDSKGVTGEIIRGDLKAGRRKTKRLVQQGGDWWTVTPAQLRRYILNHLERIDLRKVDKVAFVQIVAGEPLEAITIPKKKGRGK